MNITKKKILIIYLFLSENDLLGIQNNSSTKGIYKNKTSVNVRNTN